MKAILNGIITTLLGLCFIAFGIYDFWVNKGAVSAMKWSDIATIILIVGVGVVLVLSPDKFITEFVAGVRVGIKKLAGKDDSDKLPKP
jgi:hypothetical protein